MYLTEQHVALNFGTDCPRHHSVTEDAFDYLERMPEGEYDLIILDPPAFAKHRKVLRNALIGYRNINSIAFKKIAPRWDCLYLQLLTGSIEGRIPLGGLHRSGGIRA